jgi:hypothetical protein
MDGLTQSADDHHAHGVVACKQVCCNIGHLLLLPMVHWALPTWHMLLRACSCLCPAWHPGTAQSDQPVATQRKAHTGETLCKLMWLMPRQLMFRVPCDANRIACQIEWIAVVAACSVLAELKVSCL